MEAWMIILIVFAILIVAVASLAIVWVVEVRKVLKGLKRKVEANFPEMQQILTKKYDFYTKFLNFLKNHTKENVLDEVAALNQTCLKEPNANNDFALNLKLKELVESLEKQEKLQQNEEYVSLLQEKQQVEDEATERVKIYNGMVEAYNEKVKNFPSNFVAQKFNFEIMDYFRITDKTE